MDRTKTLSSLPPAELPMQLDSASHNIDEYLHSTPKAGQTIGEIVRMAQPAIVALQILRGELDVTDARITLERAERQQ
jgi:hypothetical protein